MPEAAGNQAIFVVGIGYVGRRILQQLPNDTAIGLSRSADSARGSAARGSGLGLPLGCQPRSPQETVYELDLDKHATLPIEPSTGYAMLYTVPPDPAHADDLRLQHLFDVLPQPPMRFVYLSTTGVYGNRDGAIVDEAVALAPQTDRARRRVASEHALARYCKRTGSELIVLRVPGIYGPGRLGAERLREGLPVLQESDANPGNRIHVVDLVSCCLAALSPDVPPGIYNVGDGDTRSATWFAFEVARQCGLPPPPIVSRTQAQQQLSAERLSFLNESRRLDLTRMVTILKPRLQYADAADGIAASL